MNEELVIWAAADISGKWLPFPEVSVNLSDKFGFFS
jgi:hypothetical protein